MLFRSGRNWAHVNSVDYDPADDSIIISSRHQSAVIKIGRDKAVKWILSAPNGWNDQLKGKVLTPVDAGGKPITCRIGRCEGEFDWTWIPVFSSAYMLLFYMIFFHSRLRLLSSFYFVPAAFQAEDGIRDSLQ